MAGRPSRSKIRSYAPRCRSNERSRPSSATSKLYESFMVNSRTRSRPLLGRASSRNLVWNWYQICGRSRYERSSWDRTVKISSWVMPRAMSAPLRSLSRNISSPMTSQRPVRCQISAGCMAGRTNSWAPIAVISSRMMSTIFARTRTASGSRE
jgi:hypothetical protein